MQKRDNSGTVYLRGDIWWVKIRVNGRAVYESSKSTKLADGTKLRDKLIAQRYRGELKGGAPDTITIGELLDDVLKSDVAESTRYVWKKVVEKNIRPFFGKIRAVKLTTDKMDAYREKRKAEGRTDSTANRELSIVRTAFNNARKRTPPKVNVVPYFPMIEETTIRQGFLADEVYDRLRDELPQYLKALFVCAYETGMRKSELCKIQWWQVELDESLLTLEKYETKGRAPRTVPILDGDMHDLLVKNWEERRKHYPQCPWVFSLDGVPLKDFRTSWKNACARAGVPDFHFHDLRRTGVRNMRRAGVPQVTRMAISGHKTDSMERRYNIVDGDDLRMAKELMERRTKTVTK